MTPDDLALITEDIERAHVMAKRGANQVAAHTFAAVRAMCVALADQDELAAKLETVTQGFTRERENYRALVASRFDTGRPLVVFGDSLALPRPDDINGEYRGAERTYPYLLGEHFGDRAVDSYCQRYFTTQNVLELLLAERGLGSKSDVLLHVGLNDCATRTFTERERLSLDLFPERLKSRIVDFAQEYRPMILRELPACHYVSPERFSANLDGILALLNERGARVVVTTVIMPLARFWARTPGIQRNFTDYNLRVMDAADRHDSAVLDLDRLVWDQQHTQVLLADGMHLSLKGHQLLTRFAAQLMS